MDTEKMFSRALRALGGPRKPKAVVGGRWVLVPPSPEYPPPGGASANGSRSSAAERRRRNLTYLAVFCLVTFFLGLWDPLRFLLVANLVADVLLIVYLLAALYFAARPAKRPVPPVPVRERPAEPPEVVGGGAY